jgi:hypothetical protein
MLDLVGDCLSMTTPITVIVRTRQTNHVNTATETDKLSDPLPVALATVGADLLVTPVP